MTNLEDCQFVIRNAGIMTWVHEPKCYLTLWMGRDAMRAGHVLCGAPDVGDSSPTARTHTRTLFLLHACTVRRAAVSG